jgi:hypothetical protein
MLVTSLRALLDPMLLLKDNGIIGVDNLNDPHDVALKESRLTYCMHERDVDCWERTRLGNK